MSSRHILRVDTLSASMTRESGQINLLKDISFAIDSGEIFCLVGGSGSGKTTLAYSITRLTDDRSGIRLSGSIHLGETEILGLADESLRRIRRNDVRYIFQEPSESINPLKRIGPQMRHAMGLDRQGSNEPIISMLAKAGIEYPQEVINLYPHQLSIGMLQRVFFAMAIGVRPKLIIADEPTSAVDASLKIHLLELLNSLRKEMGMSVLLITHDFSIANRYADRIGVLYNGRLIETAPRERIYALQAHPYTKLLFAASMAVSNPAVRFTEETVTETTLKLSGCCYSQKCDRKQNDCSESEPPMEQIDTDHGVRCLHWK